MIAGDVEEGFEDVGEEFFGSSSQRQADLARSTIKPLMMEFSSGIGCKVQV
jgi:hypothetical protein